MSRPVEQVKAFLSLWERRRHAGGQHGDTIYALGTDDDEIPLKASDLRLALDETMYGTVMVGPWSDGALVGSNAELSVGLCGPCAAGLGGRVKPVYWNTDVRCGSCGDDGTYWEVALADVPEDRVQDPERRQVGARPPLPEGKAAP